MTRAKTRGRPAAPTSQVSTGPHESYPLKTVSSLTGLSADIIRAWEKRYAVVAPLRGPRGARLYSGDDVARLRLLGNLVSSGRSIGDVAGLAPDQLRLLAKMQERSEPPAGSSNAQRIADVVEALRRFDVVAVERLLGESLVALGAARFVAEIGTPLLERIGELWEAGDLSVAEEHVASATIRNLFGGLIRMQMPVRSSSILLATPAGERHDLGLSMVSLLCLQAGLTVTSAGPDLPADQIVAAALRTRAPVVGLSVISSENRDRAVSELQRVEAELPRDVAIWLGGRDASEVAGRLANTRVVVLQTLPALEREIARVARRHYAEASIPG